MLSDWEGLKTEVKRGRGIATRRFHRKNIGGETGNFSLHFGNSQALYNYARIPFKTFSLESSIPLLQDALVWSKQDVHLISN